MNSGFAALDATAAVFGIVIMITPFVRRFRDASLWLRLGLFVGGALPTAWSALGFYLLLHEADGKTSLPYSRFWAVEHMKSNIAGLGVGMLLCLILSPESRRLNRKTPGV